MLVKLGDATLRPAADRLTAGFWIDVWAILEVFRAWASEVSACKTLRLESGSVGFATWSLSLSGAN